MDGVWEKGAQKKDESCIREISVLDMTKEEIGVIRKLVDTAQKINKKIWEYCDAVGSWILER